MVWRNGEDGRKNHTRSNAALKNLRPMLQEERSVEGYTPFERVGILSIEKGDMLLRHPIHMTKVWVVADPLKIEYINGTSNKQTNNRVNSYSNF